MVSIGIWIAFIATHNSKINMRSSEYFLNEDNNDHIENAVSLFKLYQRIVSLNLILISFKILKYLGMMVERVTVMFRVINHAQSDIFYFFILYLIIFISFTTTFHIFYGSQVERFSTYGDSFNTLFLYLGRNILQIEDMKEMSFNFTVIYFIIFITSMDFILMNMFIAIIALSYSTVNKQMKEVNNEKVLNVTHWSVDVYKYYKSFRKALRNCKKKKPEKEKEMEQENPSVEKESGYIEKLEGEAKESDPPPLEKSKEDEHSSKEDEDENEDDSKDNEDSKDFEDSKDEEDSKIMNEDENQLDHNDIAIDIDDEKLKTKTASGNGAISQRSIYSQGNSDPDDEEDDEDGRNKEETNEEEEANKKQLLRMRWNVDFSLEYFTEENQVDEAIQSEKEVHDSTLRKEKELGTKLWSLIGYIVFFGFFSYLAFSQVRVSMFNMYNDALKDSIEGPLILTSEDVYYNITHLHDYSELNKWLKLGLNQIYEQDSSGKFFFINDYNYIIEESLRFCFQLSKSETNKGKGPRAAEWDRSKDGVDTEDFVGASSGFEYKFISSGYQGQGSH